MNQYSGLVMSGIINTLDTHKDTIIQIMVIIFTLRVSVVLLCVAIKSNFHS